MTTTKRLQLEPLKNYPMRPVTATMSLDSAYTVIEDAAPVTWTGANLRIGSGSILNIAKTMDDGDKLTTDDIVVNLDPGIYEVRANIHFVEGAGAAEEMRVAITNLAGSTVFHESDNIEIVANGDAFYRVTQICSITGTGDGITIRTSLQTAGTVTVQPGNVGYVRKIGNNGEA